MGRAYPASWHSKQKRAAEKLRDRYKLPDRWERSPSVNFPMLAIAHWDRQQLVTELSRGPMSGKELLAAMPHLTQQKLSMHLNYLREAEWVSWRRLPKSATKIWTLNMGIYLDVVDVLARMNAPAYERVQARRAAAQRDSV
jgi:DNA-binding HxlR family transcriptional regulator